MRIAMISEHASPLAVVSGVGAGGRHQHVAELSAVLRQLGHEVRVYTRRTGPDVPDEVRMPSGVLVQHLTAGPVQPLDPDETLPFAGAFGERLGQAWRDGGWRPEIAHAHFWVSGMAAHAARQAAPLPLVTTYHGVEVPAPGAGTPSLRAERELLLGGQVDRVVAQSTAEMRQMIRRGIPRARVSLVPGGVDVDHFSPDGPAVPRSPRYARVLAVGRLAQDKGYADLIRSLRLLPDTELVVVGGRDSADVGADPEARRLRELAERFGLADRVTLTGAVSREELPRWYRSADVVACTPARGSFGLTSLEAMSCGAPVVAYATGGLTDTVVDGVTGTLVPPRDERSLARALRRLLRDPLRRMAYATAAVDRARSCYSWRRAAEQLQRLYADVAAGYARSLAGPPATGAVAG
jgi:D-inositol-3-phosphate glycosyltransferase